MNPLALLSLPFALPALPRIPWGPVLVVAGTVLVLGQVYSLGVRHERARTLAELAAADRRLDDLGQMIDQLVADTAADLEAAERAALDRPVISPDGCALDAGSLAALNRIR